MNPGDTSLPRADRRTSAAPAFGPPACTIRSSSKTTVPCSYTSWPVPLNATTQPPSMTVLMTRPSPSWTLRRRSCLCTGVERARESGAAAAGGDGRGDGEGEASERRAEPRRHRGKGGGMSEHPRRQEKQDERIRHGGGDGPAAHVDRRHRPGGEE